MTDKLDATSNPVAWTDADELADLDSNTCANMFNGTYIDTHSGRWIALYSQEYVTELLSIIAEFKAEEDRRKLIRDTWDSIPLHQPPKHHGRGA